MIDAEEGVTEQDAKIAGIAHERGKATIIVVNKWDAIEKDDKTIYKFTEKVRNTLVLHALCGASVRLCEDGTETAQAVRDHRHRQREPRHACGYRCTE